MAIVYFGERAFDCDLVLFDKDGTLIDFQALWASKVVAGVDRLLAATGDGSDVRQALFRALGYDVETGRFDAHGPVVTAPMQVLYTIAATVLYQFGRDWLHASQLADSQMAAAIAETFDARMIRPLADVAAMVRDLQGAGVALGVITSDDEAPAWRTLEILGAASAVGFLAGADGIHAHKPAPAAVLAACAKFGVEPARTAVVGDSTTDLLMARRAQAGLSVGVTSGLMGESDLAPMADVLLASIAEIAVQRPS
jgi:phosphoglycolate phosphatase